MLKDEKPANRNEHQNRKTEVFWHKNRKTDLKNSQNRKTENPDVPLFHAFVLENVQLLCFCSREFPSFAAIHQNCSDNCFEQLNFRLPANFVTVPNSSQPVDSLSGFT